MKLQTFDSVILEVKVVLKKMVLEIRFEEDGAQNNLAF